MADRYYGYQYDTSPRKINPENSQIRNRYSRNASQNSETVQDGRSSEKNYNSKLNKSKVAQRKNKSTNGNTANKRRAKYAREGEYIGTGKNRYENKSNTRTNNQQNRNKQNIDYEEKFDIFTENEIDGVNKAKMSVKSKLKLVMFLIAGFSVLFAISYQNSLINESFNKKEQYKREVEALSKTNQQLEVNIENSLNLNNIEQVAKEKLGMQKLTNSQKIYVSLPKQDYVAPAAETIIMDEDIGFFQKLISGFTRVIK